MLPPKGQVCEAAKGGWCALSDLLGQVGCARQGLLGALEAVLVQHIRQRLTILVLIVQHAQGHQLPCHCPTAQKCCLEPVHHKEPLSLPMGPH